MNENRIQLLSVRIARWTASEWKQSGRIAANDTREEHYRGLSTDCERIARAYNAPNLAFESPPTETFPFHDQVYTTLQEDGSIVEVWCRSRPIEDGNSTFWTTLLPSVAEVYSVSQNDEGAR